MSNTGHVIGGWVSGNAPRHAGVSDEEEAEEWPLSFRIPPQTTGQKWWSHKLYKDPKGNPVKVIYSKTKERSEILAKRFLDEPVVGFDMEWPVHPKSGRLQDRIGLIQVACEDTIVLFHIGLHVGSQSEQIIAPSLRKLIESPDIAKTGVSILQADFSRLKKYFGLRPQGAFELSHLHKLVTCSNNPEALKPAPLVKLATQVEEHLGFPLSKGSVRTSNWSKPLNPKQIEYAATDAYAGFMLFHTMNIRRMALVSVPPLPIFHERYKAERAFRGIRGEEQGGLLLHALVEGGDVLSAKEFFDQAKVENAKHGLTTPKTSQITSEVKDPSTYLDMTSRQLYERLLQRRKELAAREEVQAYMVAHNDTLKHLANLRPQCYNDLLKVKGIGQVKHKKYGNDWLKVIREFVRAQNQSNRTPHKHPAQPATTNGTNHTPRTLPAQISITPLPKSQREPGELSDSSGSSAFGSPKLRVPQMHTGLSFNFAETNLDDEIPTIDLTSTPTPGALRNCQSEFEGASSQHRAQMRQTPAPSSQVSTSAYTCNPSPASSAVYYTPPLSKSPLKRPASPYDAHRLPPSATLPSGPLLSRTLPSVTPPSGTPPSGTPPSGTPSFSMEKRIFKNKLLAYSRLIERKLPRRPPNAGPLVSDQTLNMVVILAPTTKQELQQIPGISGFIEACSKVGADLLEKVIKFMPTKS